VTILAEARRLASMSVTVEPGETSDRDATPSRRRLAANRMHRPAATCTVVNRPENEVYS